MALLFLIIESFGLSADLAQRLLILLIPEATVGRRPIMLAPAFYMWWARARRPLSEQWEQRHAVFHNL